MIIFILKVIGYWLALMFISTNLLSMAVRFLLLSPAIVEEDNPIKDFILKENLKEKKFGLVMSLVFLIAIGVYIYCLYYYWNIGIAIASIMLMLGRIPDLLYEIKTGIKTRPKTMPKTILYKIGNIFLWLSVPVVWFALKNLN